MAKKRKGRPPLRRAVSRVQIEIPLDLNDSHPEVSAAITLGRAAIAIRGGELLGERDAKFAARVLEDIHELLCRVGLAKNSVAVTAEVADRIHRSEGGSIKAAILTAIEIEKLPSDQQAISRVARALQRLRKVRKATKLR